MSTPGASRNLIIGLPSKGRLQDNAYAFLARAGLPVHKARGREYVGRLDGIDNVDIAFLSASEIAGNLESGAIHLGVTGEDLIGENLADPASSVELLLPLGFGYADVVVAVPQSWIDVRTMADLDDVARGFHARHKRRLRVATKYLNLTRDFFAEHGITDYRIVESLGATEGAPAAGAAEAIVDITSSGATLTANNLKVLDDGTMLRSQANLVASLRADWSGTSLDAAAGVLRRIEAKKNADDGFIVRARGPFDGAAVASELEQHFNCTADMALSASDGIAELSFFCASDDLHDLTAALHEKGCGAVTAKKPDYIFLAHNELYARLKKRLGSG